MQKLYNPSFSIGKRVTFQRPFHGAIQAWGSLVFFWGHNSSRLSFVGLLLFDELFGRNVVNLFSSLYNNSFVPLVDSCAFGHQKYLACLGSFSIGEPPNILFGSVYYHVFVYAF